MLKQILIQADTHTHRQNTYNNKSYPSRCQAICSYGWLWVKSRQIQSCW